MAEQITTISKEKLITYIGRIPDELMDEQIDETLIVQLDLRRGKIYANRRWKHNSIKTHRGGSH